MVFSSLPQAIYVMHRLSVIAAHAVLAFLLFAFLQSSAYAAAPTAGLMGYWTLDETSGTTASDSSGNGNTGTITGALPTAGKIGGALSFDGVDDLVTVPATAPLQQQYGGNPSWTYSAWIYPKGMGEGGAGRIFQKNIDATTNPSRYLSLTGTNALQFFTDMTCDDVLATTASNAVTLNQWNYVTATFDWSTHIGKIYVNGVEAASDPSTCNVNTDSASPLIIGNDSTGSNTFNGLIDDVRIYNRVLTVSEIQSLAAVTTPPPSTTGNTYYVATTGLDSNTCTQAKSISTPKKTIKAGLGCLVAGDTLLLLDGVYDEVIRKIPSGTSETSRVTIKALNQRKAIIRPTSTCLVDGNVSNLNFNGGEAYITIDGLVLDGSGYSDCGGLGFRPPGGGDLGLNWHNIRIINNELTNTHGTSGGGGTIYGGHHYTMRAYNIEIINNRIHDMTGGPDPLRVGYNHCIYFKADDSLIEGNTIYDCPGIGITSHQSAPSSPQANNLTVRNNIIYDTTTNGMQCINLAGSNHTAYNNICYNSGGPFVYDQGTGDSVPIQVHLGAPDNNKLFNNIVYKSKSNLGCLRVGPYATNAQVKNNICWGGVNDTILNQGTNSTVSDNLCASGAGCSVTTDPRFINASINDFHLQSTSPAVNAGVTLAEVTTDFDGKTRPQGTAYDIGAYEYGGTVVTTPPSLTLPVSSVAPGASISVTVANAPGNTTDWVSVSTPGTAGWPSPLGWQYLNGTQTAPTTPILNTTLTFTVPTTPGTYEFRLYAKDGVTDADKKATVTFTVAAAPTISISPSSANTGATISVTVSNGPGNLKDWVGIFPQGGTTVISGYWRYLNGSFTPPTTPLTSATFNLPVPTTPGTYDVRFFPNDADTPVLAQTSLTITSAVSAKFIIGDRIQTTASLNVRSTPSTSGTLLGTQATGALGTVIGGPTVADGFTWWNINYDTGADGWSVEDYLVKYTAPVSTAGNTYYVATTGSDANPGTISQPFRTLQKARDTVRTVNTAMSGDITVYIRGGTYYLSSTLTFVSADSGTNGYNVVYKAYPGEVPIVSGGQAITGWTSVGNGIYKANVGSLRFKQFYVNGTRTIRARTPNTGYNRVQSWDMTNKRININSSEISSWSQLQDVQMVMLRQWTGNRYRLSSYSVSGSTAAITLQEPDKTHAFGEHASFSYQNPYYFENAYEFLDSPGEWYLNSSTNELFYKPRAGEDMASAIAIAPNINTLIDVRGTATAHVHHIQFKGITFSHANWNPSFVAGNQGDSINWAVSGETTIPGGINVQYADHIGFERNIFEHMGSEGLTLSFDVDDTTVLGNVFMDIAASGIGVDTLNADQSVTSISAFASSRNAIKNNYITKIGQDYQSSVGIWATYPQDTIIEHNEIVDTPYSGMSVGWGWTPNNTQLQNNIIRYNRIHNTMKLIEDGGGIYTLSKQPGTYIFENYVYDQTPSQWVNSLSTLKSPGIYLDQDSNYMKLENNVVENTPLGLFLHYANNNTIINWSGTYNDYTKTNTFTTNGTFNPTAVKANAGIEPAYQDIITGGSGTVTTVSFSANPSSITSGQSSTLIWSSTNATGCTASGGWTGTKATSGTETVNPTTTTTYTLSCTGTGGTTSQSTTVTVSVVSTTGNTYYISPTGLDTNAGTSAAPWKTFAFAIPKLNPGDTLLLKNGTYNGSNSGYPSIECNSNAKNGTASARIRLKAENERMAFIKGDGGANMPFWMQGCSYWNIEGLHAENGDFIDEPSSNGGGVMEFRSSSNLIVRRNIVAHPNRYRNAHLIAFTRGSTYNLVEENELYEYHRHAIVFFGVGTDNNVARRNYVNRRYYPCLSSTWCGWAGLMVYGGNNNIYENNIAEHGARFNLEQTDGGPGPTNNKFIGNVAFNTDFGFRTAPHQSTIASEPISNYFINDVAIASSEGIYSRSSHNTVINNSSFFASAPTSIGVVADISGGAAYDSGGTYSLYAVNSLAMNSTQGTGFYIANNVGTWAFGFDSNATYNNQTNYSPNQNVTNAFTANPNMGSCYLWIPDNSPLKRAGKDLNGDGIREDIGANILYRYENGVLTNQPLWNTTTGEFPHGAIVPGLNDIAGSSAFDVHQRLNVNTNGCSFPAGYGGTIVTQPSTLTVSPSSVAPGASISVTVANAPGFVQDWVSLSTPGTAGWPSPLGWQFLNGTQTAPTTPILNATLTFTAPTTPGTYEFRLYANNGVTDADKKATVAFTVIVSPTISVSPASISTGGTITATVSNGPGNLKDWVGIFLQGSTPSNTTLLTWKYLNDTQTAPTTALTSATVTLTAPTTAGTYDIHFLPDNAYSPTLAKTTITVTAPVSAKFIIGDRVQVSSGPLNVRSTASITGTLLGTQTTGALGAVIGGPTTADGFTWWNIDYDNAPDGWSVEDYLVKATTPVPTVSISTSPSSIASGQSSTITWSSTNATSCTASGGWTGTKTTAGTETVTPTVTTTYTLSCTGTGGTTSQSAIVNVSTVTTTGNTYYISPTGLDSNAGSSAAPWKTFAFAIPKLNPGDTLVLKNGTYNGSNSGYPYIECNSNAKSGTASARITLKAENERMAFIKGDGTQSGVVRMSYCSYWDIVGLHVAGENNQVSYAGEVMFVNYSNNLKIIRNLIERPNGYANVAALLVYASNNILVEENEIYRWGQPNPCPTGSNCNNKTYDASQSNNVIFRRNYAHARLQAGERTAESYNAYPAHDTIFENNINEGGGDSFVVNPVAKDMGDSKMGDFNKFFGNISLGVYDGGAGFHFSSRCEYITPCTGNAVVSDNLFENNVVTNAGIGFRSSGGLNNYINNNNVFLASGSGVNFSSFGSYNGGSANSLYVTNTLVTGKSGASYGFYKGDATTWSVDYSKAFGFGTPFSPTSGVTNSNSSDPNAGIPSGSQVGTGAGQCAAWIPSGNTNLKGKGLNGKDIGANILYRYQDGVLTNQPLWNTTTGEFPHGAIVPGVNDIAGSSAFDVHKRLNVNTNGCSFPAGYGGTVVTTPPSLTLPISSVAPGASISVTVANAPGNTTDWVGIYSSGTLIPGYWRYLNGSYTAPTTPILNTTLTFTAPTTPGTYEFRLYANNGSTDADKKATATFTVTSGTTADTTSPTTAITLPTTGTLVSNTTAISADASDPSSSSGQATSGVTTVDFYVDGALKGSDTSSPYSFSWDTTNGGAHPCIGAHTHTLTTKATDAAGNAGTSAGITVNMNDPSYCVPADTTAPIISTISASSITTNSANISWTTNEMSTHQMEYGLTTSYGQQTTENTTLMTSHTESLSSLSAGTLYHYRVKSKDAAGNLALSLDNTFTTTPAPDTQAPTTVTNLSANNTDEYSTTLSWSAPSDSPSGGAAASYDIRYSISPITSVTFTSASQVTGEPSPATPGTTQTYILAGLSPSTAYYTAMTSKDAANNISQLSNAPSFTTKTLVVTDTTTPIISGVTANALTANSATISWTTNELADSKITYGVSATNLNQNMQTNTLSLTHSFALTNLQRKTTYYYQVTSRDAAGNTGSSAVRSFTTAAGKPSSVKNLNASHGSVILSWDLDSDPFVTGIKVFRTTTPTAINPLTGTVNLLATLPATATTYTDTSASPSATYYYTVFSVDNASIHSDPATVSFKTPDNLKQNDVVQTTASLGVYAIPSSSGTSLASQPQNSKGAIIGGPVLADTAWWWNVNYESGSDGWSKEDGFFKTTSSVVPVAFQTITPTPNTNGSTITFTTDRPSSSQVDYGPSLLYGTSTAEYYKGSLSTTHTISYQNILSCSRYHFRIRVKDFLGNESVSSDQFYTTKGCLGDAAILDSHAKYLPVGEGGTLTLGSLSLTVPSGFNTQNAAFQILKLEKDKVITSASLPSAKRLLGDHVYEFKALTSPSASITSFAKPSTVTISYDPAELTGIDESTLKLMKWNGSSWSEMPNCTINSTAKTITCALSSFSTYALMGEPPPASAPAPSGPASVPNPTPSPAPSPSPSSSPSPSPASSRGDGGGGGGGGGGGIFYPSLSAPSNVKAIGAESQIILTWKNPAESNYVRTKVIRKENFAPLSTLDGTVLYEGDREEFTDTVVQAGKTYYYGVYALDRTLSHTSVQVVSARPGQISNAEAVKMLAKPVPVSSPASYPSLKTAALPGFKFNRNLGLKFRGNDVKILQELLIAEGHLAGGNNTGYFGPLTEAGIKKFQCAKQIVCTGTPQSTGYGAVGPKTRNILNQMLAGSSSVPVPTPTSDQSALIKSLTEQLRILQQKLIELLGKQQKK